MKQLINKRGRKNGKMSIYKVCWIFTRRCNSESIKMSQQLDGGLHVVIQFQVKSTI